MSYARELGFAIKELASENPSVMQSLQSELSISKKELEKVFSGRLYLNSSDLRKVSNVCQVTPKMLMNADKAAYNSRVVHCMSEFRNSENREMILDLIDAYIDAREAN